MAVIAYKTLCSDRMVTIKLNTRSALLNYIQVYASTSESEEEEVEKFYTDLQNVKNVK